MPSTRTTPLRSAPSLADATEKTRSLVEDLQARLAPRGAAEPPVLPKTIDIEPGCTSKDEVQPETEEDLEQQLQAYFERTMPSVSRKAVAPADLRAQVIEGVVERVLADWANPQLSSPATAAIRREVIDRLLERVLEQFQRPQPAPKKLN